MQLREFIATYETGTGYKAKKTGMSSYQVQCNSHEDSSPSLTISSGDNDNVVLYCHAKCSYENILAAAGMEPSDMYNSSSRSDPYVVSKVYVYEDEAGEYLFQMERSNHFPKGIPVQVIDGEKTWGITAGSYYFKNNGWSKAKTPEQQVGKPRVLKDVRKVLFNLPAIVGNTRDTVYIVGGERDVENMSRLGLLATTNPLGEGKWNQEFNQYFKDRDVVIVPDNDGAGEMHALLIKNSLKEVAHRVRVIDLGMTEKGADFSDYIEEHTLEDFLDLVHGVTLPNARVAEEHVLGAILRNNALMGEVMENGSSDEFFVHANSLIIKAMTQCFERRLAIDKITLGEVMGRDALLASGGYGYLEDLLAKAEKVDSVESHLKLIGLKYQSRELVRVTDVIGSQAMRSPDPTALKSRLLSSLMPTDKVTKSVVNAHDFAKDYLENFDSWGEGLATGFHAFDALSGGFQDNDLVIIAGRPGQGKTTFTLNIADYVSSVLGKTVLFCSLEMGKDQVVRKILAARANVSIDSFIQRKFTQSEAKRLQDCLPKISSSLLIDDAPSLRIGGLRAKMLKLQAEGNLPVLVVIDYIQLMSGDEYNRVHEIGAIARGLKNLAKEFKIPIAALSQLSRGTETRINKRPLMSDLRDSGNIEEAADLVMFLYRDEYYERTVENVGLAELIIGKGRSIADGTVNLGFLGKYSKFSNLIEETPWKSE